MNADSFDVLVVGGGIHGAGVLQAACAAGFTALLLEERAIASGTSSRSSKLIHGGLRYLESAQLALVRESLAERARLIEIAPELVRLVPFYIPVYADMRRQPWQIRAGLSLYALLGNLTADARFTSLPRSAWSDLDGLATNGLQAVFRYYDGQTDDAALVRAVVRSSAALGGRALAPAQFVGARRVRANGGRATGYDVQYALDGRVHECFARVLVNAAGPWVNHVQQRIEPKPRAMEVELVAGAHIEVEGELRRGIYYTEAPRDRRAVFLMPWKGRTLVGTTETPFTGDPRDVKPLPREIEYLRETLARYLPQHAGRVVDAWSGLRVLPKGSGAAFHRRRDTSLVCDDEREPHLVAIYGGKLTGYRSTAQKVIERVRGTLGASSPIADTALLGLDPDG